MKTDQENRFNFCVPCELIEKSSKDKNGKEVKEMIIGGVASTNDKDEDGEILEPSGYILDRFLSSGTMNFEHLSKKSSKFIVGEPTKAKVVGDKLLIEAKLWNDSKLANEIYQTMQEMKNSGSTRKAAFSIEGKALERDKFNPKRITKALITACAITFSPVNRNSWADIVKGNQREDYIEPVYEKKSDKEDHFFEFKKGNKTFRVGKNFEVYEVISKDMSTSNTAPLIPESLNKKVRNVVEINKSLTTIINLHEKNIIDTDNFNKIKIFVKNNLDLF